MSVTKSGVHEPKTMGFTGGRENDTPIVSIVPNPYRNRLPTEVAVRIENEIGGKINVSIETLEEILKWAKEHCCEEKIGRARVFFPKRYGDPSTIVDGHRDR